MIESATPSATKPSRRWLAFAASLGTAGLVAAAVATAAPGERVTAKRPSARAAATASLALQAEVQVQHRQTPCPPGFSSFVECLDLTGDAIVRGLGRVEESAAFLLHTALPGCPFGSVGLLPSTARLSVPGKGAIELRLSGTGSRCFSLGPELSRTTETFTVTGGSGKYAGVSGSGTLARFTSPTFTGVDTWTGTLVTPGAEFDVTAPTIRGAVNKTVRAPRRAKRVRVVYAVTARDDVDATVQVSCLPGSGTRFKVGRTRVRCTARDTSANVATATFTVTVKRAR